MNEPVRKGPWRALVGVVVTIVVATAFAWAALALLFPPPRLRAIVQAQLARTLTREVRFGDATLGLFPPVRLSVKDVALAEPGGFARGTAVQCGAVQLDLDVAALLGRRFVVRSLGLDDARIHVVTWPDGHTNLDSLVRPQPAHAAGQPMDFEVRELALRRARMLLDDVRTNARRTFVVDSKVALRHAGVRWATSGATHVAGYAFGTLDAVRLTNLEQSLAKLELGVEHAGVFDTQRKRLALERLDVALGKARLALHGVIDDPGPRAGVDLRAKGSGIDVGELLGALAKADARALHGVRGAGTLDFDLAIRGRLAPQVLPQVTGTLAVRGASFRYPGAPAGVDGLRFDARFAPDSLGIANLAAQVQGQPLRGQLAVTRFANPQVAFAIQGNVDLAAVAPLVAPKDTKLAGRVAVNVTGRGPAKDPGAMALGGTAQLANVRVETPQVPKPIEGVNGRLGFSGGTANVENLTGRAGTSSFTVSGRVSRVLTLLAKPGTAPPSAVDFTFQSPRLDLAEVMPASSGPPLVLNATGGGRAGIARLVNQRLDVADVRANVALEPGIVNAPQFSVHAYGGLVTGSARMDLRDAASPAISLNARVDSLSTNALISAWTPAKNFVQGSLTSAFDLSVAGATPQQMQRTLTAVGLAEVLRGQLGPGPVLAEIARVVKLPSLEKLRFDQAHLPFHVEHGRIINEPFTLKGNFGEWTCAGTVGFDGTLDYAVSATLPAAVAQALGARSAIAAGALTDAQGNLLLDLRVTGPAKHPRVTWDAGAMRDRVAGKVSQALEQQAQKVQDELKQAVLERRHAAEDSVRRVVQRTRQAAEDSLRRRAGDVLRGFFGGGTKPAPAQPAPTPAPNPEPPPAPAPASTDTANATP